MRGHHPCLTAVTPGTAGKAHVLWPVLSTHASSGAVAPWNGVPRDFNDGREGPRERRSLYAR